jgi:flagellar biosynthetic protein FliR
MPELTQFLVGQLSVLIMVYARLGMMLMLIPGFGDSTVPAQIRLIFSLALSLVFVPVVSPMLAAHMPHTPAAFMVMAAREMTVGMFLGLIGQTIFAAVGFAGMLVAQHLSLANAMIFSPQLASQSTVIASFLSIVVVTAMFATNLHHDILVGYINSYQVFPFVSANLPWGDMSQSLAQLLGESFKIGFQMSAPFLVVGLALYLGMGLVARLIPQIQVFVVTVPIQVILGLFLLMTVLSTMVFYFLDYFTGEWTNLLAQAPIKKGGA